MFVCKLTVWLLLQLEPGESRPIVAGYFPSPLHLFFSVRFPVLLVFCWGTMRNDDRTLVGPLAGLYSNCTASPSLSAACLFSTPSFPAPARGLAIYCTTIQNIHLFSCNPSLLKFVCQLSPATCFVLHADGVTLEFTPCSTRLLHNFDIVLARNPCFHPIPPL